MSTTTALNGSTILLALKGTNTTMTTLLRSAIDELLILYKGKDRSEVKKHSVDSLLPIIERLKRYSLSNNERLLLSESQLVTYLLNGSLQKYSVDDVASHANYLATYVRDLVFGDKDSLGAVYVEKLLDVRNLRTELKENSQTLDLVKETVVGLKEIAFDFTGSLPDDYILEVYKERVNQGFLPLYVDQYLDSINAEQSQRSPEVKRAMIAYLQRVGLKPNQYGGNAPWTDDITKIVGKSGDKAPDTLLGLKHQNEVRSKEIDALKGGAGSSVSLKSIDSKIESLIGKAKPKKTFNDLEGLIETHEKGIKSLIADNQAQVEQLKKIVERMEQLYGNDEELSLAGIRKRIEALEKAKPK